MAQKDKVFAKIPRGQDLELHVKVTDVDGEKRINLREYVPSTKLYGRGVLFALSDLNAVLTGLDKIHDEYPEEVDGG